MQRLFGILLIAAAVLAGLQQATAHSNYTGRTLKSSTTGCGGCHASKSTAVTVAITGPDTVVAGQEGTFHVTISGGSGSVCVDVAVSTGSLKTTDANMKLSSGELITNGTKPMANGAYTYNFKIVAPASAQTMTVYATGMVGKSQFNFAPNKTVRVVTATTEAQSPPAPSSQNAALLPNYPDPIQNITTVAYTLAMGGTVHLAVYDLTGREVAVLTNSSWQDAGIHATRFDATALPAGIYFSRLTRTLSNGATVNVTRKMLVAR
ncbi:MAG: T9SS type A sorting domain-containing protein [Ignavibacteria bacterium]|nr:T9SS type A sorting domain-containing protein [Ignavibacteria bacterium]